MSDKATYLKGSDGKVTICVDVFDEESIWVAIRTNHGGIHCYVSMEEAKKMIDALTHLVHRAEKS